MMEVIFLLGAVQSFFLATLFFSRSDTTQPQRILIGIFLITGLLLLDHYLELSGVLHQYPHLLGVTYSLPLLLGPILLLYTQWNTRKEPPAVWRFFLVHLLPFLLSNAYLLDNYYFLSAQHKLDFYVHQSLDVSFPILFIELLLVLSVPVYSVWSIILVKKHKKHIRNEFSFTEQITLRWWEVILYCFVFLSIISIVLNMISDGLPLIGFQLADSITMGGLTIAIFFIGYYGIKQKGIYQDQKPEFPKKSKAQNKRDIDPQDVQSLIDSIEKEKLYLNSTLTLRLMAERMNTTENKLSYLINSGMNKNFYDLINEYRVEAVKKLLLDDNYNHLSILGMAFECGFNSKSSFQSVFRKQTGMTPSQYRKRSLSKKSQSI